MVMIDDLIRHEGPGTTTSLTIREDNLFVEGGVFTEPGIIENMAQTAAAGTGAELPTPGTPPPTGFIGAIKNLVINKLPKTGSRIETTVKVEHTVFNAVIIHGEIRLEEEIIAECEMKIFLIPA